MNEDNSKNLDQYVENVYKKLHDEDEDNVVVIGGMEGAGKSNFGLLLANAISPGLFIISEHIAYEPEEFIMKVKTAPRYGTVDADEGGESFMSNDATTIEGRNTKKTLQQCRRKNLNLEFLAPRHFYLNKMSLFRCHSFFYIYKKGMNKGFGIKYDPVTQVWQEGKRPWFEKKFYFKFPDLRKVDKDAWEAYIQTKNTRGDERLDRYAAECNNEKQEVIEISQEQLTEMVTKMNDEDGFALRNTKDKLDPDKVYTKFKNKGITFALTRSVCSDMNGSRA